MGDKRFGACSCKTGCENNHCTCRSSSKRCGPYCSCKTSTGCSNLVTCGCTTFCDTKKCSCNKTSINCIHNGPNACKCDPLKCVNKEHSQVNIDNFKDIKKDSMLTENIYYQDKSSYTENNITQHYTHQTINNFIVLQNPNQPIYDPNYSPHSSLTQPFTAPAINSGPRIELLEDEPSKQLQNYTDSSLDAISLPFLQHYFTQLASDATQLSSLFMSDARFSVQNNEIIGRQNIAKQLAEFSNIQGEISSQKTQKIDDNMLSINASGKMTNSLTQQSVNFTQTFYLVNNANNIYFIKYSQLTYQ